MSTKSDIRKQYKILRNKLNKSNLEQLSKSIIKVIMPLLSNEIHNAHLFLPIQKLREPDCTLLQKTAPQTIQWCVGKVVSNEEMKHYILNHDTTFEVSKWGITEPTNAKEINPTEIDLVIVPLLAFDNMGYRIGYGKGFYDRFLAQCRPDCITVGVSFFEAHPTPLPIDSWDLPLDYCATPKRLYNFTTNE